MIGCQASGAAPVPLAYRNRLPEVPILPNPTTVAASIGDATGGEHGLQAVVASGGDVATVSDDEILKAQRALASRGLLLEAASAATLAALAASARAGSVLPGERVVCLLTGSGAKWSTQLFSLAMDRVLLEPSLDAVTALATRQEPSYR